MPAGPALGLEVVMDPASMCSLISMSCTTAWTDWIHGDLWLCPDGLLRVSRGLEATIANASAKTLVKQAVDPANRPTRHISPEQVQAAVTADQRNWWIPWTDVATIKQQSGPLSHALHIQLTDGRKVSLRWLREDGPVEFLNEGLRRSLGERLTVA